MIFLIVLAPKADTDEALRMIVRIARPIAADKVMQVGSEPSRLGERPAVQINRAAAVAVDLLVREQLIDQLHRTSGTCQPRCARISSSWSTVSSRPFQPRASQYSAMNFCRAR